MTTAKKTTHVSNGVSHASAPATASEEPEASQAPAAPQGTRTASSADAVAPDPGPTPPQGNVVPKPPADWKPSKLGRGKGARARQAQTSNAAGVAKELGASTTYAADFGPHAPSQAKLGRLIGGAAAWRGQWVSAKRWTAYAAEQNADWWDAALDGASLFQPAFDYAVSRDPTIADRYPSTTQFMQAASTIAKRAAATVRKGKKAAKPEPEAATTGAAAEPATVETSEPTK